MKRYNVDYAKSAQRTLRKMDPGIRAMIMRWIDKNLVHCDNPRIHGKALAGNLSGLWRYRVGNYRLIAEIHDDRLVILMLEIGHRSEIYQ